MFCRTVECFFIFRQWLLHFLFWAFYFCFSLVACFGVSLKIAGFCEAILAIITNINFCQFGDVFDQKCVTFVNSDSHDVFQLIRRVPSETPIDFPIFLPFGLVHPDPHPFSKLFFFIQILLHLVKFFETGSWDII